MEGERSIWIWAPIITKRCPECENSPSYHEQSDCEYDEIPPDEWSKGLVEKGRKDDRTNEYTLTDRGRSELEARREWEEDVVGSQVQAAVA